MSSRAILTPLALILAGASAAGAVFLSPLGAVLGPLFREDFLLPPLLLGGLFLWLGRAGRLRTPLESCLALVAFWLPVAGLWATGLSQGDVFAGLLPFSDAGGYFADALRLLDFGRMSSFSSRRPLFAGELATLLRLSGWSLPVSLALLSALDALAALSAARAVVDSHGRGAGAVVLALLFLFARRFAGLALTEHLGLALGCAGFACLWPVAPTHRLAPALLGLALLALALNARAGAFFVLPALALWLGALRPAPARFRWRAVALGVLAIGLGFAANRLVLAQCGQPGAAFSNFGYHLYGMAAGGDWTTIYARHPELRELREPERSSRALALALAQLRTHPLGPARTALKAWTKTLVGARGQLFSFLFLRSRDVDAAISGRWRELRPTGWLSFFGLGCAFFAANGLALAWAVALVQRRGRPDPHDALLVVFLAGFALSLPFAPPWDGDNLRVHAAVLPFLCAMPALGFGALRRGREPATGDAPGWLGPGVLGLALSLLCVAGPLLAKGSGPPSGMEAEPTPLDEPVSTTIAAGRGVGVFLGANAPRGWRPLDWERFAAGRALFDSAYPGTAAELDLLGPGDVVLQTVTLDTGQSHNFVFRAEGGPPPGPGQGVVRVRGRALAGRLKLFVAEGWEALGE